MTSEQKFREEKLKNMGQYCKKVLDIGQSARDDKKYFSATKYITLDLDSTIKPDIISDICNMHMIADGEFDGVICCAILEHVYAPWIAVKELGRITSKGGRLFGYVPFLSVYHAKPGHYSDYYRYTAEGVRHLFLEEGGFSSCEIHPVRGNVTTIMHQIPYLNKIQGMFRWADRFFSNKQVSGYNFFCIK